MIGPKTTRLIALLRELGALLREVDEAQWADWVTESARRLRQRDFSGISHLQSAYGGMASFNDIFPELAGEQFDDRVRRIRQLRSEVWQVAEEIRHEAETG